MTIALKCIAGVFVVSLIESHLTVIFLGGNERIWVGVMYQLINNALSILWKNFKRFYATSAT